MWYATRGSGYTALVLITVSVLLGLMTSARWSAAGWPRFLSQSLHRNVSLLVVAFLLVHIVTSIADPFAGLSARDAVIPVGSSYRPVWLGLGVVSAELFIAIVLTSLIRHRLNFRAWQVVHLLAYVSWPVAVLHSIATGTDSKAVWALLLVAACVGAVVAALVWRLARGWPRLAALRAAGIAASLASVVALVAWIASGPLQPGWARAAGTPADLLARAGNGTPAQSSPTPAQPALPAGLNDQLSGSATRGATSVTVTLQDNTDPSLRVQIVANQSGAGRLVITRNGATLCATSASIGQAVSAQCGSVAVQVQVFDQGSGSVGGTLVTRLVGR